MIDPAVQQAFTDAGLRTDKVALKFGILGGTVLTVTGWHQDNTPFAFASASFRGDPVKRAREIAADLVRAHSGWPTGLASGPPPSIQSRKPVMGKLGTLADRMGAFKKRLDSRADRLMAKVDAAEKQGEEAFDKHEAYVEQTEAEIAELVDTVNQLSNGPPDGK